MVLIHKIFHHSIIDDVTIIDIHLKSCSIVLSILLALIRSCAKISLFVVCYCEVYTPSIKANLIFPLCDKAYFIQANINERWFWFYRRNRVFEVRTGSLTRINKCITSLLTFFTKADMFSNSKSTMTHCQKQECEIDIEFFLLIIC